MRTQKAISFALLFIMIVSLSSVFVGESQEGEYQLPEAMDDAQIEDSDFGEKSFTMLQTKLRTIPSGELDRALTSPARMVAGLYVPSPKDQRTSRSIMSDVVSSRVT